MFSICVMYINFKRNFIEIYKIMLCVVYNILYKNKNQALFIIKCYILVDTL